MGRGRSNTTKGASSDGARKKDPINAQRGAILELERRDRRGGPNRVTIVW